MYIWFINLTWLHCLCTLTSPVTGFTFLNIFYFFKYSCSNIFHRRSLYTFYYYGYQTIFVFILWYFFRILIPILFYFFGFIICFHNGRCRITNPVWTTAELIRFAPGVKYLYDSVYLYCQWNIWKYIHIHIWNHLVENYFHDWKA